VAPIHSPNDRCHLYRHRPKRRKSAQAAAIKVPRIVQQTPTGKGVEALKSLATGPEAEARAAAFFAEMIRPRS